MGAVADGNSAVHFHTGTAQGRHFFQEGHGVEHHTIADDTTAAGAQHTTRHQLQNEFLVTDDDGMARVMSATISCHDGEVFREDVDDLALTLVPPLRTYNDRSLALLQIQLRGSKLHGCPSRLAGSHTLLAPAKMRNC